MKEQTGLIKYLILPQETTEVELQHVRRINRVALGACLAHIPLFVLVAWLCNTSILQALGFGAMLVAGPLVATKTLSNPRHLSLVFGFTSMGLGALLVHLGQGPMQIEMHFHFFAALALLTVWGNPLIIWVATVTVALHHGLFYFFLPKSVFNYDASIWVVLVHATFVVVEAVAAAFIARNFFDNVIGLEKIVTKKTEELSVRNQDMRMILDNAEEGFLTCALDGTVGSEYSQIVTKWFGTPTATSKIWELVAAKNLKKMAAFKCGWSQLTEDILPFEVSAGQMPSVFQNGSLHFGFNFTPIYNDQKALVKILVVVMDVTAKVEADLKERQQQELFATFQAISKDRSGFLEYFADAEGMVRALSKSNPQLPKEDQFRMVHTLKGNSAQYGLTTLADVCHEMESRIQESGGPLSRTDTEQLAQTWADISARLITLIGSREKKSIELDLSEYTHVLQRLRNGATVQEISAYIESWRLEPAQKKLERMAEQAKSLAERLGIQDLTVRAHDGGLRLEPDAFFEVWSSLIHVVRNSIDHGFAAASIAKPVLQLATSASDKHIHISINDNGAGINWEKVREKAQRMNLPCSTQADLEACLFADGLSTKDDVTTVSGRGIGMSAVKAAVSGFGGSISVVSAKGKGTEFKFTLPVQAQAISLVKKVA